MMKNKNIIFYILIFLFLFSLVVSIFKIPNYSTLNVIIETKQTKNDDFLVKYNENYYPFFTNKNAINKIIDEKVDKIEILKNKNYNNKITSIVVFNKYKTFYYNDFSNFKKNEEKICFNNSCKIYDKFEIPNNIKLNSKSNFLNENTTFNSFSNIIYNFVRLNPVFLNSYILLSLLIIYFINNKNKITFKFNNKLYLATIFLLIVCLNLYENKTFLPWGDEIYALTCANPILGITSIFNDPGVPPFYYLVLKIYISIFSADILNIRLLSLILILGGFSILYRFILKNFNKTSANISLTLLFLNIPMMYHSKQIRCYCLFIFLFILLFYFFFKILKKNVSKKDYIIYFLLSILIINTHYFGFLAVFGNMFFSCYISILKKAYKKAKNLIILHFCALFSLLPFFIITAYTKALKDNSFNSMISTLSYENTINCILFIANGAISLIIFSVCTYFYFKNKANKKQKLIVIYSIFITFFTIFSALILSYLIRPMLTTRFMLIFIPLFIMLSSVYLSFMNKKTVVVFLLWIFFSQSYMIKNEENYIKRRTSENNIYYISKQFELNNKKKTYVLTRPSGQIYGHYFTDLLDKNIDYIFIKQDKSIKNKDYANKLINDELDKIKAKNAPATVFTTILPIDNKINNLNNYTCFFNPTQDLCYWKIELN